MKELLTVIKTWEKHQFPKLRSVLVDDNNDNGRSECAIADVMRAGADTSGKTQFVNPS
jgi:hypothetical protein